MHGDQSSNSVLPSWSPTTRSFITRCKSSYLAPNVCYFIASYDRISSTPTGKLFVQSERKIMCFVVKQVNLRITCTFLPSSSPWTGCFNWPEGNWPGVVTIFFALILSKEEDEDLDITWWFCTVSVFDNYFLNPWTWLLRCSRNTLPYRQILSANCQAVFISSLKRGIVMDSCDTAETYRNCCWKFCSNVFFQFASKDFSNNRYRRLIKKIMSSWRASDHCFTQPWKPIDTCAFTVYLHHLGNDKLSFAIYRN